jgi:competence protein ComEA
MESEKRFGSLTEILLIIIGTALVGAVAFGLAHRPSPVVVNVVPPQPTRYLAPIPTPTAGMARVHILGSVKAPGVYTMPAGALVQDALEAAGGSTADADIEQLNLAAEVEDHQQIVVPRRITEATPEEYNVRTKGIPVNNLIDINAADSKTLQELPGIGPVLAGRIIEFREQKGAFTDIEELVDVKGIGDKMMEKLRPLITVGH